MTSSIDQEKLRSFIFYELSDDERQILEERFFEDEELFYELLGLENDLVDRYVSKELSADEQNRFEKSLINLPTRQEKVANAQALQTFIVEENFSNAETVFDVADTEKQPLTEKHTGLFNLRMPMMQYLTAVIILLFVGGGIGYLVYDRIHLNNEMVEIKKQQAEQQRLQELEEKQKQLEEQKRRLEQREKEMGNPTPDVNPNTEVTPDQTDKKAELERIKKQKRKTETEQKRLEEEKRKNDKTLPPVQKKDLPQPPKPVIASISLLPLVGSKGGGGKITEVEKNVATVNVTLQIPEDVESETFRVLLNGVEILKDAKPKGKTINIRINTKNLTPGQQNRITLIADNGKRKDYGFKIKEK